MHKDSLYNNITENSINQIRDSSSCIIQVSVYQNASVYTRQLRHSWALSRLPQSRSGFLVLTHSQPGGNKAKTSGGLIHTGPKNFINKSSLVGLSITHITTVLVRWTAR